MTEKRKSRDGHARKPAKGQPATVEPPDDAPPPGPPFDPKAVVEKLDLWLLKGKDCYLRPAPSGKDWLPEPSKAIARLLRLHGIRSEKFGRTFSQTDQVLQYVHDYRFVTFAQPLSGKKAGVHYIGEDEETPIIATNSFRMIEPVPGPWPLHRALLEGLLKTEEADQTPWLYAWLKTSRAALRAGVMRPAPWLIFSGPSNCGKSFVQGAVLTPLLGGRHADPADWILEKTQHNAEIIGSEHVMIEELAGKLDGASRSMLAERMKQVVVNKEQRWRGMYNDGFMVPVFWRASLSINHSSDRLKTLPPLCGNFADKVILFACESRPMPMPTDSNDGWQALSRALALERPAFAHYLDCEFEIPSEMRRTSQTERYGFDSFHHPRPVATMFDQEAESSLLYLLDKSPELYGDRGAWGWASSKALHELLCEDARFQEHAAQARKLLSAFNNACGTYLSKLADKFPARFEKKHTNKDNLWLIRAPES